MRILIFLFVLFASISKAQVVTKQLPTGLLTTEGTYTPTATSVTSNYSVSPFLAYQIGSAISKDGKGEVFENGNVVTVYVRAETNKNINNAASYNLNFSYTIQ